MRDWFNARDRGRASGILNSASTLGTGVAAPLLTTLMLLFGWRWMFAIMGLLGIGAAVIWFALYRNPSQVALTEAEHHYRTAGDAPEVARPVTFVVVTAFVSSNTVAVACLCGAMFCGTVATTCAWAMASIAAPANSTGSLGSLQNFGGYLGGALAPIVTGFIVQGTGSFVPALIVGAAMCVFAAVSYFVILRRPINAGGPSAKVAGRDGFGLTPGGKWLKGRMSAPAARRAGTSTVPKRSRVAAPGASRQALPCLAAIKRRARSCRVRSRWRRS